MTLESSTMMNCAEARMIRGSHFRIARLYGWNALDAIRRNPYCGGEHTFVPIRDPKERPVLTARQQEIWNYLVEYVDRHGYPPTVREIGEQVGLASPSTVHAHLAN